MTFYLKPMTTVSQRCGTSDDQQILNCVSPTFGDWKTIDWGRSSIGNLLNGMELASSFVDHFSTGSIPAFNVTRCPQFNILTDKNCWSTNVKLCHRLKDFLERHMWSKLKRLYIQSFKRIKLAQILVSTMEVTDLWRI